MKIQRTKNAGRFIVFNGALTVFNMVVPFVMRTLVLHYLGVTYLGLGGLFHSILSFLSLADLGVGSAMVFSMYKPIAEDDEATICALLRLYRNVYRVIGLFIMAVGLALTPFLPVLVKGDVPPDMNLYILYFINLGHTALSYWLFAYKNSLLYAHQRRDVSSKVGLAVRFGEYALKAVALIVFRNYYLYLIIQLASQVVSNIVTAYFTTRLFPQYSPRGSLPKEKMLDIVHRVRDLFTAKLSYVVFTSADTLVISSFMGLIPLALYQNYYYIINSLRSFLEVVIGACIAGVGNSLVTESPEKNYHDLERLTLLFCWVMAVTTSMLMCMYQPFMYLWMGEARMLAFPIVVCFTAYYYFLGVNMLINMYKDAAGIWKTDRWRPLTGALVNLGLNLATVQWLGLYGVILSSVVSVAVVQLPWLFHNLFQKVFPHEYLWRFTRFFCVFLVIALAACVISWYVCSLIHLGPWPTLFANACVSFAVPNVILFVLFGRNSLFTESLAQFKRIFLAKIKKRPA